MYTVRPIEYGEMSEIKVVRNELEFKQFCMNILLDKRVQMHETERDMEYLEKRLVLDLAHKVVDKKVIVARAEATAVVYYPDGLWQCFKALLREKFPRLFGWVDYREAELRDEQVSSDKVTIDVMQYYPQIVRTNDNPTIVFHTCDVRREKNEV